MRAALFHLRTERPEAREFQDVLDELNRGALRAATLLGWQTRLFASAEAPVQASLDAAADADVVVLLGGEDIDPQRYGGAADYPGGGGHEPDADAAHLAVIEQALARRQPLLGVCRGLQVVNVALGGTLIQDLGPDSAHRSAAGAGMARFTTARVNADGLPEAAGAGPVYCSHHQAVDRLGSGLQVVARAPDGVVEAVVHTRAPITGVQWHPEHPAVAETQLTRLLRRLEAQHRNT
ncbi:gamma-glutamyl-gamma-aminobutyrate hydrolase family protein [Mycolicibacterium brumae]|uniref:gamma-glutamyl-gamma-aminobutyrate hydrolase family protein n=1 Tax=Mycolicibacterium brumae TaxID=85968 RepID=UPI000B10F9D9|nr:gamma-glutamyl-gamma-aminobutyrate hydrolase family protein [Mycolicibacterium brumae]RWA15175.1 hypothetical protein MBRU_11195 [Mycolicibacterium brumae DSM 44177]UWW08244.1 gamma-glutamyl-gamma-aminobutyrate hydrolase family protein [Mycolicibacterium brumae]